MLLALVMLVAPSMASQPAEQPVEYNHQVHTVTLGIACQNCHQGVESRRRAGFPPDAFCQACHSSPQGESAEEAKLVEFLQAGSALAWTQVTNVADHVLFSHRRHVALGNIDCIACHGDMRDRVRPITAAVVSFEGRKGMLRCIGCHVDGGSPYAGIDCMDCHR